MKRAAFTWHHLLRGIPLLVAGCTITDPVVDAPPDTPQPNVSIYADVVLGIGLGMEVEACVEGIPLCGQMPEQTGPCGDNAALGAKDGVTYDLPALGRLELGFLCGSIRETGGNTASDDFRIWGTVVGAAQPVIEVSQDATQYEAVNLWPRNGAAFVADPGFQLEVAQWPVARFVRISEVGGQGGLKIDAIEALPTRLSQ